jgi:hypothetical protein
MRIPIVALAISVLAFPVAGQSDVEIKDDVASRFTKTKGASLLGQTVHWHVPAKVFHLPKKSRAGVALFVSQGIGVLADEQSNAVEEVRRRGGDACVRGRVIRVPDDQKAPGDPSYAIVVLSLSHRKHQK